MIEQLTPLFEELLAKIIFYIPRLVSALVVLFVGLKTHPVFANWINDFFKKRDYDVSLERFLESFLGLAYRIVVLLVAISIAGVETASIVAALGAAGFAVGLALQGSMSNFASGILLLTLKPIKVGEYIGLDSYSGTVNKIEIFNTTLLTPDNKTVIIPNSDLTSKSLINYSRQNIRRIDYKIGVSYNSDLKKVRKIFENTIAKQSERVISNDSNSTFIGVDNLADSAVIFTINVWCKSSDYWTLKHELLEQIKIALDKAKVEIPFQKITITKQ